MSVFDTPNQDAYTIAPEQGARGPQLGFQDALVASWQAQVRVHSLLGVEQAFRDVEQAQIKKMRDRGIDAPPSLDEGETSPLMTQFRQGRYSAAAQSIQDGGGWYTDEIVQERDARIKRLQELHPDLGLKTYGEMFKDVQARGQEALQRDSLPKTFGGHVGGFIGGAAAGLNPVSDPLNFASFILTAPLGGESVLARTAVQGVAQGATEAAQIAVEPPNKQLITGVAETAQEKLARVGMATAGGAGGQLLGEAIGAGVRRYATGKWFADLPPDKLPTRTVPAPDDVMRGMVDDLANGVERRMPPDRPFAEYPTFEAFARSQGYDLGNPYGSTRQAALRHAQDIDYVARQLDRWDGPAAHEIAARTDTALPGDVQPGVRYDGVYQRYVDRLENVDDITRRLDSDLFALYDKLERQRTEMRASIEAERVRFRDFNGPDTMFEGALEAHAARDVEARAELQKIDYQMRDMAPLVSRAYAAAEKEWRAGAASDFAVQRFLRGVEDRSGFRYRGEDKPSLTEQPMKRAAAPETTARQELGDAIPLSVLTPQQQSKLRPGQHDAADRVAIAVKDSLDVADNNVDKFMGDVKKAATMDAAEWTTAKDLANDKLIKAQQALAKAGAPSSTGIKEAFDTLKGGGVSEDFYKRAFAAFEKGSIRVAGVNEAVLWRARRTGERFASWEDVKAYYEQVMSSVKNVTGDAPVDAVAKAKADLDALTGITLPDGRRLDFNDTMIDADGNKVTVRKYLQEMDKNVEALASVRTCSLPS